MLEMNLCYGCMNEKNLDENGNCTICGYNENTPHLPSYLAPGTVLNERYIVGKIKSYNGESAVYLGFDTITSSKVMIKEYMPDTLCSREKSSALINVDQNYVAQYKTFMSEFVELNKTLSKMRTLSHVISVTDLFGENNTGYAIMTYFDGITLSEHLKNNAGELSWEEVKKIFPPIFTTLSLVHNAGLIHRGISPDNILINDRGEIKLTGFAIADERTANTELAPELYNGYAAPEQYNSNNWQGTWTDVYGICALLYRVLIGVVPTNALDRITNDNLIEPAMLNTNIPKNVSKVIMNGLNLNSEMRIQTITELVTQLFEQPEYTSVRLSSSSTQTIAIPKQSASNKSSRSKNRPISRHKLFVSIVAAILGVGAFFMIIMILATQSFLDNDDVDISVTTINTNETTIQQTAPATTPAPMTEVTPKQTTANQTIYIMNDITGKNYDILSRSETYSSLIFNPVYEYNDTVAAGLIIEQSIPKNDSYTEGTEITVKVSLGPKFVPVPEYISLNKKDYFALLNEAGIKYEEKELETDSVKSGYVAKTSKEPGEKIDVEAGEVLTVFIAKKPPELENDTEKNDKEDEIIPDVTSVPDDPEPDLDVSISYYDYN